MRTILLALLVIVGVVSCAPKQKVAPVQKAPAPKPTLTQQGKFDFEGLWFQVPKGARLVKTSSEGIDLFIQSPQGYIITADMRRVPGGRTLEELERAMDQRFLGPGKRWEKKLAYRSFPVADQNAFDLLYQGSHTTDRVLIWLNGDKAYTFAFIASSPSFDRLTKEFDLFIDSFEAERTSVKVEPVPPRAAKARVAEIAKTAPKSSNLKVFEGEVSGFSMGYPKSWVKERTGPSRVEFGGAVGSADYQVFVEVQNVYAPQVSGKNLKNHVLVEQLREQILELGKNVVFDQAAQGAMREGRSELTATYRYKGERFRQWMAVLPRSDGQKVHVWTFTAPVSMFEDYAALANQILDSFQIN